MSVTDPEWLKAELAKPGRSQAALARHLGLDSSAINRLVNGGRDLKAREVEAIEEYLAQTDKGLSPLAERVNRRLVALGLNPLRAATEAGLGKDYVRDIMRGRVIDPSAKALDAVAAVLHTTPKWLLFGEGEESEAAAEPSPHSTPRKPPGELTITNGRVKLNLTAEVSIATAARILAMIEADLSPTPR